MTGRVGTGETTSMLFALLLQWSPLFVYKFTIWGNSQSFWNLSALICHGPANSSFREHWFGDKSSALARARMIEVVTVNPKSAFLPAAFPYSLWPPLRGVAHMWLAPKFLVKNSNVKNPGTGRSSAGKGHLLLLSPRTLLNFEFHPDHWKQRNKSQALHNPTQLTPRPTKLSGQSSAFRLRCICHWMYYHQFLFNLNSTACKGGQAGS